MAGRHAIPREPDTDRERVALMVRNLAPTLGTPTPTPFAELVDLLDGVIHEITCRVYDTIPKATGGEFHDTSSGYEKAAQYDHERPPIGFRADEPTYQKDHS